MTSVEIFFEDLCIEKQDEILEAAAVENPEDMNFDYIPLFIMDFEKKLLN